MAGEIGENEWRQILELAHAAAELPEEARRKFVESTCDNPAVAVRVLELAEEFSSHTLRLDVGSQVGRFTVTGRIGRGGKGEVFSARDPELERTVALKVLRSDAEGSIGPVQVVREARTASALNHPNIVTIYEVLKIGSAVAIVMEFVPGEPLREWIKIRHSLSESLPMMMQMASAVEAAHAAGIVHRDLKPENTMVRPDNRIKVLDFGLARSVDVGDRTTLASAGGLAGTFLYMAPEQWTGASPSTASDVFSLGLIFYEVLTGQHPFQAPSLLDLMRALSEQTPLPPSTLQQSIPHVLNSLVLRMLSKNAADRPSAHEVVATLMQVANSATAPTTFASPRRWGRRAVTVTIGLLALIGLIWRLGLLDSIFPRSRIAEDFVVVPLANELGLNSSPTFSPEGSQIAFSWNGKTQDNFDIYVKVVGAPESVRLTTSPEVDFSPVWSPDGKTIAFCRGAQNGYASVWTMSSLGGSEKKIYDLHWRADFGNRHLSWSPDGKRIVFPDRSSDGNTNPLIELDMTTGSSRQITFPTGSQIDLQPAHSPNGKYLAFVRDLGGVVNQIHLLPLTGGAAKPFLLEWEGLSEIDAERPVWTPDSQSVAVISKRGGDYRLWIGPAEQYGKPQVLSSLGSNLSDSAISPNGKLALVHRHYDSDVYKLDLGRLREGIGVTPVPVANTTRLELNPRVSPDGRKIAFESNRSGFMEVWTANIDGSNAAPLTEMQTAVTGSPSWSHDGRKLAFDSRLGGPPKLYVIDALGGKSTAITRNEDIAVVPIWSADDAWVYFSSDRVKISEIWRIPSAGGPTEQVTKGGGFAAILSPDGTQLYFSSSRTHITELRMFDLVTRKQVMIAPDVLRRSYVATRDGVYYVSGQLLGPRNLKLIDRSGRAKQIYRFEKPLAEGMDVSPDGRILFFGQLEQNGSELMLVDNFWR